jgi:hypothetical protein
MVQIGSDKQNGSMLLAAPEEWGFAVARSLS